jgi:autotransporter-associated beta strand protein
MEGFVGLGCNTRAVTQERRRLGRLRGTASHAVLALAAVVALGGSAWASVDAGTSANISSLGSSITLNGGTVVIDGSKTFGNAISFNSVSGNTIDAKGATASLTGKLSGSGDIIFANTGSGGVLSLLNSSNDYTGKTTINSGATLALVDSNASSDTNTDSGTIARSQMVTVNGTLDISGTVGGASLIGMQGSGNVVLGAETLTLYDYDSTAAVTYPTNTIFSGVISGTGGLLLSSGEITLTGVNTLTGAVTISSDTLHLSGNGSISQASSVVVYGTLDATAANSAVFKSLTGSGTVSLGSNDLVLTAASGSFTGVITTTGKLVLNGGTEYLGGTTNTFGQGVVINSGTLEIGGASTDMTIGYNVANSDTLTYYNTYGVTMNGVVSGTGGVDKWGSGIATITTVQTYTGATVISSGTLKLTGDGAIAASSGVEVDSILDLTESNGASIQSLTGIGTVRLGTQALTVTAGNGDFSGTITGTGGLVVAGGTQSLSGTNTYTGATSVTGGKLILVAGSSLKSSVTLAGGYLQVNPGVTATGNATIISLASADPSSSVMLGANTLVLSSANDEFKGAITGTGNLTIAGGTETLSGTSTYSGTTTVSAGSLILTGSLSSSSKLVINGTFDATNAADAALSYVSLAGSGAVKLGGHALTLNTASGVTTVFSGVLSGTAGLTVSGQGTQVLSGANTYTGGTTVNSGAMLQIGNGNNTGSITGNILDNGTVRFYRLDSTVFSGVISGSGAVIQGGIGTTILTADNTYTGGTTITAGTLQIGDGTHASGSITGDITDNGTLAFARTGSTTINAVVSGYGSLAINAGTIALTGVSTYTGNTTIASGAELDLVGSAAIASSNRVIANGTFDISGTPGASIISLSGNGAVNLGAQALTITAGNDSFDGTLSGTGGLIINSGSETLSGNSSAFTGTTTVNGGALTVTGSIANSAMTVKSGGLVAGTGTVGALTVESGGTVKAGVNGAGTLTVNGAMTLASGGTYAVDVTSAGSAKLAVNGTAGLHGTLAITSSDGTYDLGHKVTVLTATGGIDYTGLTAATTFSGANKAVFKETLDEQANALAVTVNLYQLSPALVAAGTPTQNQTNVVTGIDKALAYADSQHSSAPAAFQALGNDTGAELLTDTAALAGEIGADTSLAAKAMFSPFLDSLSERTAMLRPLGNGQARPFETWVAGFGGTDTVAGDAGVGTHKFRANVDGVVVGAQWSPWANTLIGGAIGAGTSDFHIAGDLGKGTATSIEAGVYGYIQASRHIYNSFAAGVSTTEIKTSRVISVNGDDTLTGKLTAYTFGGRYEAGLQLPLVTPYIGVQDHVTMLPGYTEGASAGAATYALKYDSRTVNAGRAEIGLRHFIDLEVTPRWILTPDFTVHLNDRLAYAYDLGDGPEASAMFASLPQSDFTTFGAKSGRHAGIASIGADVLFTNGLHLTTHFDAEVSQKSEAFTGFAGFGYTW